MPTAMELLFKITAQGTSELDKVALATKAVGEGTALAGAQLKTFDSTLKSLVDGSGKTYRAALEEMARSNGVLSSSIVNTSKALLEHMRAAEGDEAAVRGLTGATQGLVGANVAAGAAIRDLTGASNTRALENLLTKTLGLGAAFQGMFVITGVVAFGEELYHLWQKYDPLSAATKKLAADQRDLNEAVAEGVKKIRAYNEEYIRKTQGPEAAQRYAADIDLSQAQSLQRKLDGLNKRIADAEGKRYAAHNYSQDDLALPIPGRGPRLPNNAALETQISDLKVQKTKLEEDQRVAAAHAKAEGAPDSFAAGKTAAEKLKELLKRNQEITTQFVDRAKSAEGKNLDPFSEVRERIQGQINAASKPGEPLTPEAMAAAQRESAAEMAAAFRRIVENARKEGAKLPDVLGKLTENAGVDTKGEDRYGAKKFQDNLKKEIAKEEKDLNALLKVISSGDQSDADGVRRGLQVAIAGNATAARGGRISGGTAAGNDLQARIDAANQIYAIETKYLDLITDEGQREEKLADAKKNYADELYQAEAQYEEQLDALREKDLQKYQNLAGKIFDALINRQRGARFELVQMLRGEAVNTGRQIFENLAAKTLQEVGHATAGVIPGQSAAGGVLGGILKGTVFSSANKGVPAVADPAATARDTAITATATHTQTASDWLKQIYGLISGNTPTDPGAANPTSDAESAALPGGAPLAAMTAAAVASLPAALASTASVGTGVLAGLAKATSGLGGFGSGMGSVLSGNALSTMLGYGTPGVNGQPGTDPSTIQQIGAGVGIAGALAAGGMGIASGISQGGARGDLTAAGSAAGVAAMAVSNIAKLAGAASPFLSAVPIVGSALAAVLPLVGSLFGTGPTQRANQINTELAKNQYLAPTAMNVTQGMNGTYEDFDAHGNLRTSTMSAVPTVAEPYITSTRLTPGGPLSYYNAPGQVTAPYTGSATGTGVAPVSNAPQPVIIQAMDAQSFSDFAQKNNNVFGEALTTHLQSGNGQRTADTIRFHSGS